MWASKAFVSHLCSTAMWIKKKLPANGFQKFKRLLMLKLERLVHVNLQGRKEGQARLHYYSPSEPEVDHSYHILYIKYSFLTVGTRASAEQ